MNDATAWQHYLMRRIGPENAPKPGSKPPPPPPLAPGSAGGPPRPAHERDIHTQVSHGDQPDPDNRRARPDVSDSAASGDRGDDGDGDADGSGDSDGDA